MLAEQILWSARDADPRLVSRYVMMARKWYKEWGANNVVRHMDSKYGAYIEKAESSMLWKDLPESNPLSVDARGMPN